MREEEKTKYWFPIKFWPAAVSDVTQPPSSADTVWAGPACITLEHPRYFFPGSNPSLAQTRSAGAGVDDHWWDDQQLIQTGKKQICKEHLYLLDKSERLGLA